MFAFKLWGHFGVFRDPLTITQNITFSIPPKTTIGGMLAAVLGIDYNDYFTDENYFDFQYSLVLNNHTRKKSFSQNYVAMYTARSASKVSGINNLVNNKKLGKKEKLAVENFRFKIQSDPKYKTPIKPIRRELLINPSYTIFINNYKYEDEIIAIMKKHQSSFMFYMGNSEFPANYEYLDCLEIQNCELSNVDSFTHSLDKIKFEEGNKYSTVYFATKVVGNRQYRDYKKLVLGDYDKTISFKEPINGYSIKLKTGDYNCEFI